MHKHLTAAPFAAAYCADLMVVGVLLEPNQFA